MEPTISTILIILLILAVINYLSRVAMDRIQTQLTFTPPPGGLQIQREGFTDGDGSDKKEVYMNNDELYDSFYASIYDQLTQGVGRTNTKVDFLLADWKKEGFEVNKMEILDAGCGTGIAVSAFAHAGVKSVLGLDKSPAMLERAEKYTIPNTKLTPEQKKAISFRQGDLMNPSAVAASSITHMVCFYFTIYYLQDKDAFFRNANSWVKPGGKLIVEVVNKYKFDPMLDSSAPWLSFSLQKYSKERITDSKVTFDKFEYHGKFDLQDPGAEFRETFRFKDGHTRRQKHRMIMPSIQEIVKSAQAAGWVYTRYFDLTPLGFEYAYILSFRRKE